MNIFEKLRDAGINYIKTGDYTCPQCSDTRKKKNIKCFHIEFRESGVVYRCNHCDFQGGFYHENFRGDTVKKQYKKPEPPKVIDNKDRVYKYLEKRGISRKTVDLFEVGYNDKKEIVMPLHKDGELINIKYRGENKKFRQEKDAMPVLYGMKQVEEICLENNTDTLVWVEGEFDCMSFAEIGIPAVSVPSGASSTKMEYIENCYDWLKAFKIHIIAVDSDEAGKVLRDNLIIRLGKEKCKLINFEDYGVKDSNELLVKSKDFLREAYNSAKYISIDRTITYDDVKHQILDLYNDKVNRGISTGWETLDDLIRIKKGKLMVVTGYPSRGKSFFTDNLLLNLTESHKWKHLLFTFENDPKNHFARMCAMKTGKNFYGNDFKLSEKEIKDNINYFNDYFFFSDNTEVWSIKDIIKKATEFVEHRGVDTIVIDPWDRLDVPTGEKEHLYIRKILSELSAFAKKMNILIIFIAHPKKPDGEDAPNMYSISGSTAWYNACDYGIIIHRDRDKDKQLENKTQVIIAKIKDVDLGNPSGGLERLRFSNNRLKEL